MIIDFQKRTAESPPSPLARIQYLEERNAELEWDMAEISRALDRKLGSRWRDILRGRHITPDRWFIMACWAILAISSVLR